MSAIPRGVLLRCNVKQILTRSFGYHDHHVTISFDALSRGFDDSIDAESDFRDEANAYLGVRQGGEAGDEPGVTTHQLHQTDAGPMARRFHIRRARRLPRCLDGGLETERCINERDIVVDRLRYAHHSD